MLRFIRLSLVAAATTALVACGGGAKLGGGKEGAAKAAFQAGAPASQGAKSSQSLLRQMAAGAATGTAEFSVDCAKSGSVKLTLDLTSTGNQSGAFTYKASYNKCNQDGANSYDGDVTIDFNFAGLSLATHFKGKVDISGDISDSIDADVTETFAITSISATSGAVSITVNGSIKTSSGSYTYANEALNITVDGSLPADNGNS